MIQLAWRRYFALKKEQVNKAVRDKVVRIGQGVSACEQAILAKTETKDEEKAELISSGKETSVEEVWAVEGAKENIVSYGHKIRAWAAWSLQARADVKEAHEEPVEVKAPEKAADSKAALGKESTREAPYEQRVEAWVERFGNKAHGSRATKGTAKAKAAPKEDSSAKFPLKKIVSQG